MVNPEHSKLSHFNVASKDAERPKRVPVVPKARKDFQKVLKKDERHGKEGKDERQAVKGEKHSIKDEGESKTAIKDQPEGQEKSSVSLFDLSRGSTNKAIKGAQAEQLAMANEVNLAQPSESKTAEAPKPFDLGKPVKTEEVATITTAETQGGTAASMGAVQPGPAEAQVNVASTQRAAPTTNIQEIVNQIVDKATAMQVDGKTETTLTLKNNTLLQGAQVKITEFDTARGEFNISFQGLTQAAKQVLDVNQDSLRQALEQKGYTVHIFTATTIVETTKAEQGTNLAKDSQEEKEEGQHPEGQKKDKRDEETT